MREKGSPCPECKQIEVCAKCKSEIADIVWKASVCVADYDGEMANDLFSVIADPPRSWFDE